MNNNQTVYFYSVILMLLQVFLAFSGAVLFLLKPTTFYLPFSLICFIGFILVFYASLEMKTFEYENTMQFISIKQSYFWKLNRTIIPIEFPNYKLIGFSIDKIVFTTLLVLVVKSKEQKIKKTVL
ncbi:hypothetical protein [Chryseobacterium echinoideorum]|uniref:hypothetical protein n=1 Tax=Chryseobacterium echinoideorum TaxID=1549648 RepID=UPI001185331B|nr:hypothetical protein [Chryseobacterium echinoideorum]